MKKWRDSSDEFSDDEDEAAFQSSNETRRRLNAYKIKRIKHNHPDSNVSFGREIFSEKAWELLGSYVAQNDFVECMSLRQCNLNDANMSLFFNGGATGAKTKVLNLFGNSFGSDGMRALVPLLNNAFGLSSLNVMGNPIGSDGLWWLCNGLDGSSIEKLNLRHCELTNISVLERCTLSNLQVLYLSDNSNIGADGCKSVSQLLQRGGSKLKKLYVNRCNIRDEGAEVIAQAMMSNKSLTHIELETNDIRGQGHLALLRVVLDVLSVETTYNSNHRLRLISVKGNPPSEYSQHIEDAVQLNRSCGGDLVRAGRAKVRKYHLKSNIRTELSRLQGVFDYFMRPYANMDSEVLPDAVALVGKVSGLSDVYRLLLARNSGLGFSAYGTENKHLKEKIAELDAIVVEQNRQIAALTARNLDLRTRLLSMEHFAQRIQSNIEGVSQGDEAHRSGGQKRPRTEYPPP
ncbi:hypothetical protein ACHAXT_002137 [Thalassiosira profunda]